MTNSKHRTLPPLLHFLVDVVIYVQSITRPHLPMPLSLQATMVRKNTRPLTPEKSKRLHEHNASCYTTSQPSYGFVGRDPDILQIEKRLLTKRNILLMRGMGGAGKTTLLHHLGAWWQSTQFVEEVFYFAYDERAWTRQQILKRIAEALMSKVEYLQIFEPLWPDRLQPRCYQLSKQEMCNSTPKIVRRRPRTFCAASITPTAISRKKLNPCLPALLHSHQSCSSTFLTHILHS